MDSLVFLCAPTAAIASSFGALDVFGQSIYPFKLVVPALFIATFERSMALLRRRGSFAWLFWILAGWSIVGLAWTSDRMAGVREASILLFAALALTSLAAAAYRPSGVRALLRGWVCAGYLTALVAIWEIATGKHLESVFVTDLGSQVDGVILSTFGNPNNFGAFVVLTVPFVGLAASKAGALWGLQPRDRLAARIVGVVLPALLVFSGSRLALIGLVLSGVLYVVLNRKWRSAWRFGTAISALALVASVLAISSGLRLVKKFEAITSAEPFTLNSVQTRVNLVWNGIDFAWRSHGVGLGPAGFETAIEAGDYRFPVKPGVVNAHNFGIEMFSQYGVVGIGVLILVLLAATAAFFRFRRESSSLAQERAASICLAGFAGYLVASCAASSYVNSPENWLFIASYVAMVPALSTARQFVPTADGAESRQKTQELTDRESAFP